MTTMTAEPGRVPGRRHHLDVDVAAAVDHLAGVLGTASFPTTAAGDRRLLRWLCSFCPLHQVGMEGTGSYGGALVRYRSGTDVRGAGPSARSRRGWGATQRLDVLA